MALPQLAVVAILMWWDRPLYAAAVAAVLIAQILLMPRLLSDPRGKAAWYNATGVTLYVSGMLISAFAVRTLVVGGA